MKKIIKKSGKMLVEILKQFKPTKEDLKGAGLAALVSGSILLAYLSATYIPNKIQGWIYNSTQHITYSDVNNDDRKDIVLIDPKNKIYDVLIQKSNGQYERGKIRVQDGIWFVVTKSGIYDPWGGYFPIKEKK